jgi:hypothetical protein
MALIIAFALVLLVQAAIILIKNTRPRLYSWHQWATRLALLDNTS